MWNALNARLVRRFKCRSRLTFFGLASNFFGLSEEYIKSVYRQFFLLKYHGSWSLIELYNLPIKLRNWFSSELADQLKKESDQIEKASKKSKSSSPRISK